MLRWDPSHAASFVSLSEFARGGPHTGHEGDDDAGLRRTAH
ncbi:MAG: hypothetical protein AVDCRST_MAG18-2968 [uncultured Thermomicrobiales bacterium]|uniref:Uncharacterized protein n=1 Tax=uncultured Thermomicrobiales bacterium TaxID=1645740 RepID=A0A6J4VJA5_9BACT|nr:MAG: hypothetical protein AVDCRST_MAG18-2968 [uncultured Thermomicrobiales bacterium]